jgi:hypothetical protein
MKSLANQSQGQKDKYNIDKPLKQNRPKAHTLNGNASTARMTQ